MATWYCDMTDSADAPPVIHPVTDTGGVEESPPLSPVLHSDPQEQLLYSSRHGEFNEVKQLLEDNEAGKVEVDINCKGTNKANLGWTPLHLASYFGHTDVVEALLEYGARVNLVNRDGDTPLHRAAYTGREKVVTLLLKKNADVTIINAEGHTPKHMTANPEIRRLIEAAENFENKKVEDMFFQAARDGDVGSLKYLLLSPSPPNINSTDDHGNTALHCAAYRRQTEAAVLLLQNGIDTTLKNKKGQTALDMAKSSKMRQLLDVKPVKELQKHVQRFEGPLLKKTRFTGWKPVWAVLERGVLSYFNTRADATTGVKRKGFKYLDNARIKPLSDDGTVFVLQYSDDTKHTLTVLSSEGGDHIDKQKWLNSLNDHIAYSTYYTNKGCNYVDEDVEDLLPLGSMQDALQTAQAHHVALEKHVAHVTTLINSVSDDKPIVKTDSLPQTIQGSAQALKNDFSQIVSASRDMCNALSHCLNLLTQQEEIRKLQLTQEMEKSRVLQEALHVLATEHHELEQSIHVGRRSPSRYYDTDDDEFYDCDEGPTDYECFSDLLESQVPRKPTHHPSNSLSSDIFKEARDSPASKWGGSMAEGINTQAGSELEVQNEWRKNVRSCLPVPMFSRNDFSVWSILKQCIGKELSKITMPVIFNEPLSFLQRLTEYMEYYYLLDKASSCTDSLERIQYVTAFAVSATASNWDRLGKPFNPLLGETYELEREDLGFRIVCEQVSHHPPVSAFHVESQNYRFHGTIQPKLKFWGKSVEVQPKGTLTVELLRHGETYTWHNVNCSVHNIIVGKLWVEHAGVMEVTNHKTKEKVSLHFKPCGWFGKDVHKLEGHVYNKEKEKVRCLYGSWVDSLFSVDVEVYESWLKTSKNKSGKQISVKQNGANNDFKDCSDQLESVNTAPDDIPKKASNCDLRLPGQEMLWKSEERPEHSKQYYSFTSFAMMLNELDNDLQTSLPPTDSRIRPDIRRLEDGDIDGAAEEKVRLEEKQRSARKERKKFKEDWKPRWFISAVHPDVGKDDWIYTGEYWTLRDWKRCPNIF